MKKLKILFATLCCALCLCLPLAACNSNLKYYVNDSLKSTVKYMNTAYVLQGEFKINPPDIGAYEVEYTFEVKTDVGTQSQTGMTEIEVYDLGEQTVSFYLTCFYENGSAKVETITLTKINLTKTASFDVDDEVEKPTRTDLAYGLGFGIPSAVILCGLTVVFILDKTGVFKKR